MENMDDYKNEDKLRKKYCYWQFQWRLYQTGQEILQILNKTNKTV